MKNFFFIFLFLVPLLGSSQKQKPVYYYDINDYQISEKVYLEKYRNREDNISYHSLSFENDTSYIQKLVKRKQYGKLNLEVLNELMNFLNSKQELKKEKYTIIQYHPGKDRCNGGEFRGNRYNRSYLKKLKKSLSFNNYWIHKEDSSIKFNKPPWIDWQLDSNQLIEKLFFKYHYPCYSFVIINNQTRNYISILGEYGDYSLLKLAEEIINL